METEGTHWLSQLLKALSAYQARPETYLFLLGGVVCILLYLLLASRNRVQKLAEKIEDAAEQLLQLETDNTTLRKSEIDLKVKEAQLVTLIRTERRNSAEKLALLEDARNDLRLQFSTLAREILDENNESFNTRSKERLESLLHPFHLQLDELKKEIRQTYLSDTRERTTLQSELAHLKEMNLKISQEAVNLTRALKGDKKLQGNWGELVLEKILEQSGLRKDHEFELQKGMRGTDNKLFKPDVVIHLPDNRDIIIDSKVSLVAWEKYCSSDDTMIQQKALGQQATAIRNHITTLSSKSYEDLVGSRSLDFVLMFMPVDALFMAAFDHDRTLFDEAINKKVVIVTPTTLMATLRTVQNIWRYEQQSRNSLEIARKAGTLYDKFRGFVEDLDKIGKQLQGCNSAYDSAMAKLSRGRGNLVSQASQLIDLGVRVKKELPKEIIEQQDTGQKN
ncbi:DNA recombination protein RmuC [Desulfopila sp. IMCC35008]|uniref:DNA recombination protein RmuC n=1 Tax=Desulfopila sp. IMCC35008 TaxID=2653858 RepID=UPI0013D3D573|nr:DNA recombination protein RmuC [Desulfopila sp. IMCC35008]